MNNNNVSPIPVTADQADDIMLALDYLASAERANSNYREADKYASLSHAIHGWIQSPNGVWGSDDYGNAIYFAP